jgi:DNA topoisomerase-3
MKTLVFAEKPSVGKDIARILGATIRGNGYLEGNNYIVTWGFGHLVALGHPEVQNSNWKNWNMNILPMIPKEWKCVVLPASKEQYDNVANLFNRSDVDCLINAADAGREGELIFRLVYQQCGCKKPFKRLWISSMTDEAIKSGFEDLRPGEKYDNLAKAAVCRSRADWLVGMNLTRAYTKKLNTMFTLGRVQTPTLWMVVKRHDEITHFVPKDYWEVEAFLGDFTAQWFSPEADEYPTRIDSFEKATELAERVKGKTAIVGSVKKTSKKQSPPSLYDLTTLQRDANSKYSMTAADTLATLQGLYEKRKVVTYPRTDSRYLSEDIFPTIEKRIAGLPPEYSSYLGYLRKNRPKKDKRVFNNSKVSDHHAVIPTEKPVRDMSGWSSAEKRIYDLVVRRFLAVFYPDHQYMSTVVVVKIDEDSFKATGKVVTDEGWRVLYPKKQLQANQTAINEKSSDSSDDEDNIQALPELKKGDKRLVVNSNLLTKKTKPPLAYTEATLLQAMETAGKMVEDEELREAMKDGGLGTPATRAEIIEKLIKVGYMFRDKKKLIPTEKGINIINNAEQEIISPELTGKWEKRLADISHGQDNDAEFMNDISEFVTRIVGKIKTSNILKNLASSIKNTYGGWKNTNAVGEAEVLKKSEATKSPSIPKPTKIVKKDSKPITREVIAPCPACGKGGIIEGQRGFGCNRFKEGCHYVVWKEMYGKKLSKSAIKALIEGKPTRVMSGFKLEDGTIVSGRIKMKDDKSGIELVWVANPSQEK